MDSGCSKHNTKRIKDFISLKELHGRNFFFGSKKNENIKGVGMIGRSSNHAIKNVYFVNWLKYSLLSMSGICDKGNKVRFLSDKCIVTSLNSDEVVLKAKRCKNTYVEDLGSVLGNDQICLSAQTYSTELWHQRLGHVGSSLLNKLVTRVLV